MKFIKNTLITTAKALLRQIIVIAEALLGLADNTTAEGGKTATKSPKSRASANTSAKPVSRNAGQGKAKNYHKPKTANNTAGQYHTNRGNSYKRPNTVTSQYVRQTPRSADETVAYLERCAAAGERLFVDTCALLNSGFHKFYERYLSVHNRHPEFKMEIPGSVTWELIHIADNPKKDGELRKKASATLQFISQEVQKEHIVIRGGDESEQRFNKQGNLAYHADQIFIEKLRVLCNMGDKCLVITQDRALAEDLQKLNDNSSYTVRGAVYVRSLTPEGQLRTPTPLTASQRNNPKGPSNPSTPSNQSTPSSSDSNGGMSEFDSILSQFQ